MTYENIFLLLGSNLGDRLANLQRCTQLIREDIGKIVKQSSIYETVAWGKTDEPSYLNLALQIDSNLRPLDLLHSCLSIENKLGRTREEKWGSRTIDVDVIYFAQRVIDSKDLKIPHPRITERKFVLAPLVEISPEFSHPVFQKTNTQLLRECPDPLAVNIFSSSLLG
jgi:2-amino-4-hydroxy-6-hydroxymethyldihydropteridine diphosphokinase